MQFFTTGDWAFVSEKNIEFFHRDNMKKILKGKQNLSSARQKLFDSALIEIEEKFSEMFGEVNKRLKLQRNSQVKVLNPRYKF